MIDRETESAALIALLRESTESWGRIASKVAFENSASALRAEQLDGTLFDAFGPDEHLEAARSDVQSWTGRGLRHVTVLDPEYPERLLDIRETPPFLFYEGDLRREDPGMSVVGSRNASAGAQRLAAEVARFLVSRNLTVISGLAAGIDTAAHRAALDAGGRTVAFIGTGITRAYPAANASLQGTIAERGLVMSQFFPDAPPSKQSFPMRNATMSGYGLATIVIEAGETSGTRIQARLAGQHGRPVILTERVATATSWGQELRTRPGVHVITSIEDLADVVTKIQDQPRQVDAALAALTGA